MPKPTFTALHDAKVIAVLERLHHEADRQIPSLLLHYLPKLPGLLFGKGLPWDQTKTDFYQDKYLPLSPDQGCLLYLLARSINAKTIVEFGTSFGISTIYLATAVRDNGGGQVVGTEIVPEKAAQARQNVQAAGLEAFVDIREGNAIDTLSHVDQSIDMVLIDGWAHLALPILQQLDPRANASCQ